MANPKFDLTIQAHNRPLKSLPATEPELLDKLSDLDDEPDVWAMPTARQDDHIRHMVFGELDGHRVSKMALITGVAKLGNSIDELKGLIKAQIHVRHVEVLRDLAYKRDPDDYRRWTPLGTSWNPPQS